MVPTCDNPAGPRPSIASSSLTAGTGFADVPRWPGAGAPPAAGAGLLCAGAGLGRGCLTAGCAAGVPAGMLNVAEAAGAPAAPEGLELGLCSGRAGAAGCAPGAPSRAAPAALRCACTINSPWSMVKGTGTQPVFCAHSCRSAGGMRPWRSTAGGRSACSVATGTSTHPQSWRNCWCCLAVGGHCRIPASDRCGAARAAARCVAGGKPC